MHVFELRNRPIVVVAYDHLEELLFSSFRQNCSLQDLVKVDERVYQQLHRIAVQVATSVCMELIVSMPF